MGTKERFKRFLQGAGGVPELISSVESSIPDVGDQLLPELNAMTAQELSDLRDKLRGYKVFSAHLYQSGINAPTNGVIFENSLGFTPTWERTDTGVYGISNIPVGVNITKLGGFISGHWYGRIVDLVFWKEALPPLVHILLYSYTHGASSLIAADGGWAESNPLYIEIRLYS